MNDCFDFSVALLSEGRLVEYGRVTDLLSDPKSEFQKLVAKAGLSSARKGQLV